ncbi:hypothetical protein SpCBS45565_g05586 [Spizellomyces sp. 'palustris']|nr:hypothetical protein SpCBS45565_g05586 [Spizellomyces sp. 'palustris']
MEATRDWLRGVLGPYHHRDRVFRDADTVLVNFNGLAPKTDTYTHEDGRTVVLLCLHGTIPIKFRGVTYNIPIAAWVPYTYPAQPPICFVTPTSSMLVRASKHVDLSGKIYHPYLAYWHMNSEESNILQFMRTLQEIFALEPPVYTKPSNPNPPSATPATYPPPGYTNPTQPVGGSPQPYPNVNRQNYAQASVNYYPQQAQQQLSMPDPRRHSTPPPGAQPPPVPPPPSYVLTGRAGSPHQQPLPHRSQSTPPPPIPAKPLAAALDGQAYQSALDERTAKLNALREAVKDRLRHRQRELNAAIPADIERLLHVNKRLSEGEVSISETIRKLGQEQGNVQNNIELLQQKNKELSESIDALRQQPDVNVDDVVGGSTVVYNQLFELVAEDHAIDDALYYLGKALDAEKIESAAFLKNVRGLAREQFMKRALIKKIRQHAGLTDTI